MMKTVRSVAAMIVVAALAVYVYDFYKRVDRKQASDEAAIIREQTQILQQQAAEVREQLRTANDEAAALKNEVAGQRRDETERKAQQLAAGVLAEGLQLAAGIKAAVAESYQTNMKWPASNQEAGLPEPDQLSSRSLQRVQVLRNGVIALTYNEKSGVAGGVIKLIPDVRAGGGQVSWSCVSDSYESIAALIPQCTYINMSSRADSQTGSVSR